MKNNQFLESVHTDKDQHIIYCNGCFKLAATKFDKSDPKRYIREYEDEDDLYEAVPLQRPDTKQVMLLERKVGTDPQAESFPYRLAEGMVAFDQETGDPCDMYQEYYLDHNGNFHIKYEKYDRTLISLCGVDQQERLNQFMSKASLIAFL